MKDNNVFIQARANKENAIKEKAAINEMQQINYKFLVSLRTNLLPFFKKLQQIHKNKIELTSEELKLINNSIDALKFYTRKEAETSRLLKNEQNIIDDINNELIIIKQIINAVERTHPDFDELEKETELLESRLIKMQKDLDADNLKLAA
ncbi:MAG: hypothetical protein ACP5N2_04190 [Candidatus Nanoarchaeia archaeon]